MRQTLVSQVAMVTISLYSSRFDPQSGQWLDVSSLSSPRKHLGVAVYCNMLYAVGGRDQLSELSTVEK